MGETSWLASTSGSPIREPRECARRNASERTSSLFAHEDPHDFAHLPSSRPFPAMLD